MLMNPKLSCACTPAKMPPFEININTVAIKSNNNMDVLKMTFDLKLNWSAHLSKKINEANKAHHTIK